MAIATLHLETWDSSGFADLLYDNTNGVGTGITYANPTPYAVAVTVTDNQLQQTKTTVLAPGQSGSPALPAGAVTLQQGTNKQGQTVWFVPNRYTVSVASL